MLPFRILWPRKVLSQGLSIHRPFMIRIATDCQIVLQTFIIGSAEALPILCVRYIRWERERDTERERERERRKWRHHCRAKIGDEFCTSPCQNCAPQYWRKVLRFSLPKNLHLSFSPFEMRWVHTFHCQKRCTFRNGSYSSHCQMAWLTGDRSSKAHDRISGCTVLLSRRKNRKNESN